MRLSVIIPVYNGGDVWRQCLQSLANSVRPPDELITVDDASTDRSAEIAREAGARVVCLSGHPHGPAFARNRGAEFATGEVLVFLDADVAVHPETLTRIENCMQEDTDITAVFGSYDARPAGRGIVSRYKNLLHHYVHQHARRDAFTFWAGCGAIRREVLKKVGGFDEHYARPSIEDIELGARVRQAGYRIRLCPTIQVTHLKRWTITSLLRSDIFDRAIPWSRLLITHRNLPNDLNLDWRNRLGAAAVWLSIILLVLGILFKPLWLAALVAWLGALLIHLELYAFFLEKGGAVFAIAAIGLYMLYLLYSSAAFGLVVLLEWLKRLRIGWSSQE